MEETFRKEFVNYISNDEQTLNFVLNNSFDEIWFWDNDILESNFLNKHIYCKIGYENNSIKNWDGIVYRQDLDNAVDALKSYVLTPSSKFESVVKYRHVNGSIVWLMFYATVVNTRKKNKPIILGGFHDITSSRKFDKEILFLADSLDNSLDGYDIVDQDGNFVYANRAYLEMWGYQDVEEVIGTSPENHCEDPDTVRKIISMVNDKGKAELEFKAQRKDGSLFDVFMSVSKYADEKGNIFYPSFSQDITEKKIKEKELEKHRNQLEKLVEEKTKKITSSEARYKTISDLSTDYSYSHVIDDNGKISVEWSFGAFKEITGYEPEDIIRPGYVRKYIHPDDLEKALDRGKRLMKGEEVTSELRVITKDGKTKWVKDKGVPEWDKEKKRVIRMIGTAREITAEKEATSALEESEERFREIIKYSNVGISLADGDGKMLDVNDELLKSLGYKREEFLELSFIDISHSEDLELEMPLYNKVKRGELDNYRLEKRLRKKNGNYIWFDAAITVRRNANAEIELFIAMVIDITERKRAEEELRKSAFILKNTNDAIITTGTDGLIHLWNKGAEHIYGYTREEAIGQPITMIYKEEDYPVLEKMIGDLLAEKSIENIEVTCLDKNGKEVEILLSLSTLNDDDGNVVELVGFTKDITALKNTERKLLEQNERYEELNDKLVKTNTELFTAKEKAEEANRLKSEFLHNMSHEIRTPMNGIIGFSNLLGEEGVNTDQLKYYTSIIKNSSNQLLRVIDDILEISRLETKQLKLNEETFSLHDFILELFSVFDLKSKERKIPIYVNAGIEEKNSKIISDKAKLNKILGNLLENALKFTPEGFVEIGYNVKGDQLIIYVKDSGIGISPENIERIFERFSQESADIARSHGGLGLGLSISQENAELLGGSISVVSEKGKGSTFSLTLPYRKAEVVEDKNVVNPESEQDKKETFTILVAEDEEVNYLYIETVLSSVKEVNLKLLHAKNGEEAVEFCMNDGTITLVLMDIKMPIMSGYEATRKIKDVFPNLPVVAQTAYSTEADRKMALRNGCDDFISKPIRKEDLLELVGQYLYA